MRTLFAKLLGGRPMQKMSYAFQDRVSYEHVYYWQDYFGRRWLATGRWAWFRVAAAPSVEQKEGESAS